VKTHLNFSTTDLAKSITFYSTLLDARPKKLLSDYALFITDEPPLELTLTVKTASHLTGDHYGIFVETTEEVDRAIARIQNAGLVASIEREQTCCYANQTKVWVTDPLGRRWEIYTVHEDIDERDTFTTSCCTDASSTDPACCSAPTASVSR